MGNRDRNRDPGSEAKRDKGQTHDYSGEAQNVNDDKGRALNTDESQHARNKANEGIRQNRDEEHWNSES